MACRMQMARQLQHIILLWTLGTERYGPLASVYFLGACLTKEGLSQAVHRAWKPDHADIQACIEAQAAA